ncbi:hypothetical protein SGLAM104S_01856 [Streptomyces glaucescens]
MRKDATAVQDANKALARYWFDEGWTRGNVDVADRVFAPGFVLGGEPVGPEGPKRSVRRRHAAFAGLTVEVGLQIAEGPWVATWFTTRATHVGEFAGIAPTGRPVTSEGVQLSAGRGRPGRGGPQCVRPLEGRVPTPRYEPE